MSGSLNSGGAWMLTKEEQRKAVRRTEEEAIEVLCNLADSNTIYAPAARTAMECVENYSADARMLCLLLERAMDGWFAKPDTHENLKPKSGARANGPRAENPGPPVKEREPFSDSRP